MNLNAILPAIDISLDLDRFENSILQLYNTFFPIKHRILSYKDKLKPWISFDIKQSMKKGKFILIYIEEGSYPLTNIINTVI